MPWNAEFISAGPWVGSFFFAFLKCLFGLMLSLNAANLLFF